MIDFFDDIFKLPLVTFLGGIVIGIFVGVAGKYYADLYTDKRRQKESRSDLQQKFDRCRQEMPKLIEEMAQDIANELKYEFFIIDVRFTYGGFSRDCFLYATNGASNEEHFDEKRKLWVHTNILNKVRMLENNGFVIDVTAGTAPHFRITEEFVGLLRSEVAVKKGKAGAGR